MRPAAEMASLYVFFGLIASGKSTLAAAFASRHGFPLLNTDRVRKELAGVDPASRQADGLEQGIYTGEFTRRTYQAMLDNAEDKIQSGCPAVVMDGSYKDREERRRVLELAAKLGARCVFIQCVCGEKTVRERLALRARDPRAVSDGNWDIYLAQKQGFQPPVELDAARLIVLETGQSVAELLESLATSLNLR